MNPPNTGAAGSSPNLADNAAAATSSAVHSAQDAASSITQRNTGSSSPAQPNATNKSGSGSDDWAFASREKGSSPLGTFLFVSLRAADVYLQYALVRYGILPRAISALPIGGHIVPHLALASTSIIGLGLTPYHTLLTSFAFTAALKQILWQLFISEQKMPAPFALIVAAFNTFLNTLNTALSLHSWTSPASSPTSSAIPIGIALFTSGIALEFVSEVQRKIFKSDPKNRGKPYGGGLWAYATNINYGGYTLWRAGYACVAGRMSWGGLVGAFVGSDLMRRAVPSMDRYCEGRYGREWVRIRERTRWRLIPGLC